MSDNAQEQVTAGLIGAMQLHLDAAAVEPGLEPKVVGYASVIVYLRTDGTSGLTVIAPYEDADTVASLLDRAHELVVTSDPDDTVEP